MDIPPRPLHCRHLRDPLRQGGARLNAEAGKPVLEKVGCAQTLPQPVFGCEVMTRCLPFWKPSDEHFAAYQEREDKLSEVCARCPHRSTGDAAQN